MLNMSRDLSHKIRRSVERPDFAAALSCDALLSRRRPIQDGLGSHLPATARWFASRDTDNVPSFLPHTAARRPLLTDSAAVQSPKEDVSPLPQADDQGISRRLDPCFGGNTGSSP